MTDPNDHDESTRTAASEEAEVGDTPATEIDPIEELHREKDALQDRLHQAVAHEISTEHREGEVMEEFRRGYMLGERLLRAAMVKVAKGE
jgi:molecular chaperone GrpE (heat shock protein)